jgi:hypothetical protein
MPPALATAAARAGGEALAIGAWRIGTRRPKREQNASARWRGVGMAGASDAGSVVSMPGGL